MSKIKYLYQIDNERLTRVLRGLSVCQMHYMKQSR